MRLKTTDVALSLIGKARVLPLLLFMMGCSLFLSNCADTPTGPPDDVKANLEYEYVRQGNYNILDDSYGINWINDKLYYAKIWLTPVDERRIEAEDSLLWVNRLDWWEIWMANHSLPDPYNEAWLKHKRHLFSVKGFTQTGQGNNDVLPIYGFGPDDGSPSTWKGNVWIAYIAITRGCDIPDMVMSSVLVHELGHDIGSLGHRCDSEDQHTPDVSCVMAKLACAKCGGSCQMKRYCGVDVYGYDNGWTDDGNHKFCNKCLENLKVRIGKAII